MDVAGFLEDLLASPGYRDQIVHVREVAPRPARHAVPGRPLSASLRRALAARGIERLYSHQARAVDLIREGRDLLVVTGTSSGKSLCYLLPLLEMLEEDPGARALLVFPTKALSRDQLLRIETALRDAGLSGVLAGVFDGDTPASTRRTLRDRGAVVVTNPDMLHAALLPEHARWAGFLSRLRLLVVDEVHTYSGIFGSNVANLMRRLSRILEHYGSDPRHVLCSATIGNPLELAKKLTGRDPALLDEDGSPRGRRTYVFWNPPRIRGTRRRSRRSANVEAHELMASLIERKIPTITFSKARITAELIHRYVVETLQRTSPGLAAKVSPYRGGYLPEERREIERRLFTGELLGVSTTRALELGIDVGGLDAAVIVGWPGTLASFFQQSGRAGRRDREALVLLVGHDTAVNQYVLRRLDYVFGRPLEQAVVSAENPYVLTGHLRCAAHELPLDDSEAEGFGPDAKTVLEVLEENEKVRRIRGRWYHAASEVPQHEISLRDATDRNVVIEEEGSHRLLGEVGKLDAPTMLHPEAIYLHRGETYRVLALDLDRSVATVRREEVDYYTQARGGDDVHHVDRALREKPFGTGTAFWGEVTAYSRVYAYERIHFYTLDAVSRHGLTLPTYPIETMSLWIEPKEELLADVRRQGLDPASGLMGIGFAARMHLPLLVSADTLDLSHSIGCVNTPWRTVFVWEHYPRGLGFTERGYERLHVLLPAVLETIRECSCRKGCPLCVGMPLNPYTVLNPERGEGVIPSKDAALSILEGLLGDGRNLENPDSSTLTDEGEGAAIRLKQSLRRRLERMREPDVFHRVALDAPVGCPTPEPAAELTTPDAARRGERRRQFTKALRRRIAARKESRT